MHLPPSRFPRLGHLASSVNIWFLFFAGVATVITSIVAIFAITQSIIGSDTIAKRVLLRNRRQTICKTLNSFGIPNSNLRQANRDISKRAVMSGAEPSVQQEIEWLSKIALGFNPDWSRPFELNGFTKSKSPAEQLFDLSNAYDVFSKSLRAQSILSSSSLMKEQQGLASHMAKYLKLNAGFRSSKPRNPNANNLHVLTEIMDIELIHPRINFSPSFQIDDIGVIHNRTRTVVDGLYDSVALKRDGIDPNPIEISTSKKEKLSNILSSDRAFDGVLPALHGYHLQLDPQSGHLRLLLEISEISYSALIATHYFGENSGLGGTYDEQTPKAKGIDRLITLSMLPVSSDGFLLAAQRSDHVGVAKLKFAPAVNGNLELRDRIGLEVDRDLFQLPDLISATIREAKEELALEIDPKRVQILGLGKLSYEEEVNTTVLLTLASVDFTVDQILKNSKYADITEGAWELTGKFYKIAIPRDSKEAEVLIRWSLHSENVAPHLVLGVLAICLPYLSQEVDERMNEEDTLKFWNTRISRLLRAKGAKVPRSVVELDR